MKNILIIILCILCAGLIYVFFIQGMLKSKNATTYGSYSCNDKQLTLTHKTSFNTIEGVLTTDDLFITYDANVFHFFEYPPTSQTITNGITSVKEMTQDEKTEYVKKMTTSQFELDQQNARAIANDFDVNGVHVQELISDTPLLEQDFKEFGNCFNSVSKEIYADIAITQREINRGSLFYVFTKVYNRK